MTTDAKDILFEGVVSFQNRPQSKFTGISKGRLCHFFYLNKEIVEVLIGENLFNNFGEEDHDNYGDFIEGYKSKLRTILKKRRDAAMTAKKREMRVFKLHAAESNDEVDIYMVKIPKTSDTVLRIVHCYVACGATLRISSNIIGAAYDVLANPLLQDCGDHLVANYAAIQCAANF